MTRRNNGGVTQVALGREGKEGTIQRRGGEIEKSGGKGGKDERREKEEEKEREERRRRGVGGEKRMTEGERVEGGRGEMEGTIRGGRGSRGEEMAE